MSLHPKPDLTHGPIQDCSNGKDDHGFDMIPDHPIAMTTDTIPEALIELAKELQGDMNLERIRNKVQQYTAKAVEEATKELKEHCEGIDHVYKRLMEIAPWSESNDMDWADEMDCGFNQLVEDRATLQKQCEALETALADWHKLADQRSEALIKAQQQCEELRYSLKETEELSTHHLKERDDLRTERDTITLMAKYLTNEVEDLRKENQQLAESLTLHQNAGLRLQQDVKPLVTYLTDFADRQDGAPDASPIDKEACNASLVIDTFLTAHPECKP